MASPMRKKRDWSTREDDAESKETAAFEATVAAAKDTAAKSGAFLSTARSDLTDHQRWLQVQSAAVEADRARHERWLQRQRDHRLAVARRERTRRRRALMRQRAFVAIRQAVWAVILFVRSLIALAIAKTAAGIKSLALLVARGFAYTAAQLGDAAHYVGRVIVAAARWTGSKLRAFGLWIGGLLSAALIWSGAKTAASARAGGSALVTGSSIAASKFTAGSSIVASKVGVVSRSAGRSLGSSLSVASAKGSDFADATGRVASRGFAAFAEKASAIQSKSKQGLAAGYAWSRTHAAALAPALYVRIAKLGRQAERYVRAGAARAKAGATRAEGMVERTSAALHERSAPPTALVETQAPEVQVPEVYGPFYEGFWVDGVSPNEPQATALASLASESAAPALVAPRVGTENALSLWAKNAWVRGRPWTRTLWMRIQAAWHQAASWSRTRDVDLSQMMIIAGAILLVCGGLLLGGGLILRAGAGAGTTPQVAEAEEETSGIAWTFAETERPLPERAVFTLSGTPESFRINGLSISGTNHSDQPLMSVRGILKPDVQRPDLKLALKVDQSAVSEGVGDADARAMDIVPENTIPAGASFKLVFPFPPEAMDGEDGITVEEFFESYGGLLLKLRYEADGKEKSLIQYLQPELFKAQLDEVSAGGS